MPIHNVAVNYQTGEAPRMLAALKSLFGVASDAEALQGLNFYVRDWLVRLTIKHEREQAIAAATAAAEAALPPPITVT